MRVFTALISLWAIFAFPQAPKIISLEEAINTALENNRNSKNAKLDIEIAKKKIWETTSAWLPQITNSNSFQHYLKLPLSIIPADSFGGKKGDYIAVPFGQLNTASATVRFDQVIFDANYLIGTESARVFMALSQQQKQKTEVEVKRLVVSSYCTALIAERNIAILQKNKESIAKTLYETEKMYENGLTEEQNHEQLKITATNVETKLSYALRSLDISYKILNLTMGIEVETPITLSESLDALALSHIDESIFQTPFVPENNIDYSLAFTNLRSKKLLLKTENTKHMPTLGAFLAGTYTGFSNEFTFFDKQQYWIGSAFVGLQLNIPILTSFKTSSRVKQARLECLKAEYDLNQAKQKLILDYETAKSDYKYSLDKFAASKQNLVLSENIERKNQVKFQEGIATSFDLRQAQEQLYSSQDQYLQSILDLINKKVILETTLNSYTNNY